MDKERIGPALGRIPSGLYIATARDEDGSPLGMLCSFVEQAAFSPPMVTVAMSPDRRLVQAFTFGDDRRIGLNILSTENQNLIGPFANPNNEDPFAETQVVDHASGLPQLARALGFLVGDFREEMPAGDHHVYLFEIIDGELMDDDLEPMIRIRRNGFNY